MASPRRSARRRPRFDRPSPRQAHEPSRRGGRVVECTALEMRHTGNRIEGSNPSLSARYWISREPRRSEANEAELCTGGHPLPARQDQRRRDRRRGCGRRQPAERATPDPRYARDRRPRAYRQYDRLADRAPRPQHWTRALIDELRRNEEAYPFNPEAQSTRWININARMSGSRVWSARSEKQTFRYRLPWGALPQWLREKVAPHGVAMA